MIWLAEKRSSETSGQRNACQRIWVACCIIPLAVCLTASTFFPYFSVLYSPFSPTTMKLKFRKKLLSDWRGWNPCCAFTHRDAQASNSQTHTLTHSLVLFFSFSSYFVVALFCFYIEPQALNVSVRDGTISIRFIVLWENYVDRFDLFSTKIAKLLFQKKEKKTRVW